MGSQTLFPGDVRGLINARIQAREETYYLVTAKELRATKSNSILVQVFMLATSVFVGGYVSVLIALKASVKLPVEATTVLQTYKTAFLGVAITFGVITAICFLLGLWHMRGIVKAGPIVLEVSGTDAEGDLPPPWV